MAKINSAESLRGLACLAVVFSHIALTFYPQLHQFFDSDLPEFKWQLWIYDSPFSFFYSGDGAVYVFFVLSGFVLTLSSLKSGMNAKRLSQAVIKRVPRLLIPALVSNLLVWAVLHWTVDTSEVSTWFQSVVVDKPQLKEALEFGTYEPFIFGESKYNVVLWTMQIELFGSFLIYLMCFLNSICWLKWLFVELTLLVTSQLSVGLMLGLLCFVVGYGLAFIHGKLPDSVALLTLLLGLYLCGFHEDSNSYIWITDRLPDVMGLDIRDVGHVLGGALVTISVLLSARLDKLLNKRWLVYLGKISFSIYLVHFICMYVVGVPVFNSLLHHHVSFGYAAFAGVVAILISTLILAPLFCEMVDEYSIRCAKWVGNEVGRAWDALH